MTDEPPDDAQEVQEGGADYVLEAEPGHYQFEVHSATAYITQDYAPDWWEDALKSVPDGAGDAGAMRRQIVFAVCALESWFFEWVRDDVLEDATQSSVLFADITARGLPNRIKCVLGEMHSRGRLDAEPGYGESDAWQDLHELLRHRNGLVHALASRPRGDIPEEAEGPRPDFRELTEMEPAWPVSVVRGVVELLSSFDDAEPPEWMELPVDEG